MSDDELRRTARAMTAPGKGILAADESAPTIAKRFAAIRLQSTEDSRRAWRQVLFGTAGLGRWIGGAILVDETLRQQADEGVSFADLLAKEGIVPGIKVDRGLHALPGFAGDSVTEGIDGLPGRLAEYRELGARFATWRAVTRIGAGSPSRTGTATNAELLARYAAACQEAGLVPIVEPEVLMTGDHTIGRCEEVTSEVLHAVFDALHRHGVLLEGMVLKPNMVVAGGDGPQPAGTGAVAQSTLRCMRRHVPAAVPGIAFLSGGLSELEATANLAAVNKEAQRTGGAPWELTFSFGRALQHTALRTWNGQERNVHAARVALLERARANAHARAGHEALADLHEALTAPDPVPAGS